jgi:hypothetical protein
MNIMMRAVRGWTWATATRQERADWIRSHHAKHCPTAAELFIRLRLRAQFRHKTIKIVPSNSMIRAGDRVGRFREGESL